MHIFVPKAANPQEPRTPLTPDSAKKLIALGCRISAETNLGLASDFHDADYEAVGVEIMTDDAHLGEADVVFGVEPPSLETVAKMQPGTTFIGPIDPFGRPELIAALRDGNISTACLELIPRTTLAQKMDIVSSQANLAGYVAVIRSAERLNRILPMMMTPSGTLPPARFLIIGVGVAGLQAIATAKRLGARVFAFDTRAVVEEQVKSLGAKFVKIDIGETGQTKDGYAKALTEEQLAMQRDGLAKVISQSDVVITTARVFGRKPPVIVTGEMVAGMKPGSVIVDLAAEGGGNVVGTVLDEEIITDNGVRIVGVGRTERLVPTHASQMFASNLANFVDHFWDDENKTMDLQKEDEILDGCILTRDGKITQERFETAQK